MGGYAASGDAGCPRRGLAGLGRCTATADSLLVPNTNWTALLPPLARYADGAPAGAGAVLRDALDRLHRRPRSSGWSALRDQLGCDHRAVFDTTYLELTQGLRATLDTDPGLIRYPDYLYTEDALFADMYFDSLHAWETGGPVPPAWRIAFQQASLGQITGAQEMLLGINAHVQNDMPFLIAALGVRTPDGVSRKHDHDAINEVLNRAYERVVTAIRQRFDPSIGLTNPDLVPADDIGGLEMVRGWRELVWRNAERLLDAKTDAQRQMVANQIQTNAALWAEGIAAVQMPGFRATRDAYCANQLG